MRIGIPKETKTHEYRVGLTPESVGELVKRGHCVMVQRNAHLRSGLNVCRGAITCFEVAAACGSPYTEPLQALGNPG